MHVAGNELFYKIKYQEGASHNTAAIKKNPNEPASPSSSRDRSAGEAMRNWPMDKNISVAEEIVEHMTLMQISGHLQVKLLEDQVRICMSAVKFGMQVYSQSRTLM
ncbi:hypothetical protein VPH35_001099 [Triticum aestivum]